MSHDSKPWFFRRFHGHTRVQHGSSILFLAAWLMVSLLGTAIESSAHGQDVEVKPDTLPRVLMLGDSISMGYHASVVSELKGEANVFRPKENCSGTTKGISKAEEWLAIEGGKFDVIHFNFGLHDLKAVAVAGDNKATNNPDDPRQADLETYEKQLSQIVERLKSSGAKLIFATTTPFPSGVKPHRDPKDAAEYNRVALEVMKNHGVAIDDLYAFAGSRLTEIQRPNNVHFSKEGSQVLGKEVAVQIRKAIRPNAAVTQTRQRLDRNRNTFAEGQNGAISTGSLPAAEAGLAMLKGGGNAVDAAVTTMLVQTVIEANLFCFGSEVPIIVYDKDRNVVEVIIGLGAAPGLATAEWFNENRKGVIQGRDDIANCNVPGTLDAFITALDRYGSKTFGECAQGMLAILNERANLDVEDLERRMRRRRDFDAPAWIKHHQNFKTMIERLVEAEASAGGDRRTGLRAVSDYFYRGPIAREIDAWSKANGGLLRYSDFAKHHTRIETPRSMKFRDYEVFKAGVWTQGPFLHQSLRLIENRDLELMKHGSADYVHLVTEAMKLAFADRDAFYGDPNFVEVPIETLMSDEYTAMRRGLLDMKIASQTQRPGNPYKMTPLLGVAPQDHQVFSGHSDDTSNCLVADQWGNVVAATPSGWGGVPAGDTGVQLGSRMIGLVTWKDHPSMVRPGKLPRITLTPTLIFKNGKPVFAISVAGGDQQDQASIQILLNRLVFGFDTEQSVKTPRFSTQHHINWFGHMPAKLGTLIVPRGTDESIVEDLTRRGHAVSNGRTAGAAVVLSIDPKTGMKQAAADRGKISVAY